jgi:hypothetical protein
MIPQNVRRRNQMKEQFAHRLAGGNPPTQKMKHHAGKRGGKNSGFCGLNYLRGLLVLTEHRK